MGLPTRAQVFVWSMYSRRTVKEAYRLQEAISTAFSEENFGDYNEKTFLDIATPAELFDWMQGPLQDGLFPDTVCCRDWWLSWERPLPHAECCPHEASCAPPGLAHSSTTTSPSRPTVRDT